MHQDNPASLGTDQVLKLLRGELTSRRRWFYRMQLLVVSVILGLLISLWSTEPAPLPWATHAAFALIAFIAMGWIAVFVWILMRRNCPSAIDRLATAWMATFACSLFLVTTVATALIRGNWEAAVGLFLPGSLLLAAALGLLRRAIAFREQLRHQLARLTNREPM